MKYSYQVKVEKKWQEKEPLFTTKTQIQVSKSILNLEARKQMPFFIIIYQKTV